MSRKAKYVVEDDKMYQLKRDGTKVELKGEKLFYAVLHGDEGERNIIVVGIRTTRKIEESVTAFYQSGSVTASGIYKETVFKLGHAICHPGDDFDVDRGLEIAIRHAKSSQRELVANSYSLLGNDRCLSIVQDELAYITDNIEKYIGQ